MVKRTLVLITICLSLTTALSAQYFLHSAGVSGATMWATLHGNQKQGAFNLQTFYVTYFPKLNIPIYNGASISAGVPFSIGMAKMNNALFEAKGSTLSYDIPFVIDYNNGYKSGERDDDDFGFYFGAGFTYTRIGFDSIGITTAKPSNPGFLIRGGARFRYSNEDHNQGFTVGLFHKAGLGIDRFKTAGINILFELN